MNKPIDETPVTTEESFLDKLEKELTKRGGGGGGRRDDDNNGKPDWPEGPSLIGSLLIGALVGVVLAILTKSKSKTKNS